MEQGKATLLEYIKKEYTHAIYFPVNVEVKDIKKILYDYIIQKILNEQICPKEVYKEIRDKINNTFKDFKIQIEFDKMDAEGNLFL